MELSMRGRLSGIVGKSAVHADGRAVVPADVAAVAEVVLACAESRIPMAVSSDANLTATADSTAVRISLGELNTVEVDAASMTLRSGAGATLDAVRSAAANAGFGLIGFPARPVATHVGSLLARGEVPRRSLTGIEAVLPTGEKVHTGGAILKDVAGYDLAAMLLGSMGRYALIVAATWRLEPDGGRLPAPAARGESSALVGPSLVAAFDPLELLRPG